jgi:hypothetical protein
VIKADAYGHGAVAVARALVADGIKSVGVATFDEALELRQAGIDVPIVILFPIPAELAPDALRALHVDHGRRSAAAEPNSGGPGRRSRAGRGRGVRPAPRTGLAIHLEVETGLGRGGPIRRTCRHCRPDRGQSARQAGRASGRILQAADAPITCAPGRPLRGRGRTARGRGR